MSRGQLFVIAAPSGAGKSTLIKELFEALDGLSFSVSWTTRAPREGEVQGRDYNFVAAAAFRRMMGEGAFLEWAVVHGQYYGTGRAEVEGRLERGEDVVLDIDVQGAAQVRRAEPRATTVFILPPDYESLRRRLTGRATDSEDVIARRLRNARGEIERWEEFDYLVINDALERAATELQAIVLAARCCAERRASRAAQIAGAFPVIEDEP